jgi:kynurenine formamidase
MDLSRQEVVMARRMGKTGTRSALLLSIAGFLAACAAPETSAPVPPPSLADQLEAARLVDLTRTLDATTLYWPTDQAGFQLEQVSHGQTPGGFFYAANRFCTAEHGGTHLDAPVHFAEQGQTVDQVPLENLMAPAVVLDLRQQAAQDRDYRLQVADVERFEQAHGRIAAGSIVLLHTGWGERWPDRKAYLGDDKPGDAGNLHFPSFGEEAARLLIDQRQVVALGLDTASIDHGPSSDFVVHQLAGAKNVLGLENLAHLDRLPPTGAYLIALPTKIGQGSGGPLRAVAILPAVAEKL